MQSFSPRLVMVLVGLSLIPAAGAAQITSTGTTSALLASPTLSPEGREAIAARIEAVDARFRAEHGGLGPESFGVQCCQITQIPAAAFQAFAGGTWSYGPFGYQGIDQSTCPPTGCRARAPVQLPSGVVVTYLDFYFEDTSSADDMFAYLYACAAGGPFSGPPQACSPLATAVSFGSSGYGYAVSQNIAYTVNNNVAYDPAAAQLYVDFYWPISVGFLEFKAVDLWWMRQVSPAPASPTFNDVPVSDPAFQFIEALASSGITVGCGGGNYCPDSPLTRRQMAVFLSKALGLSWSF